MVTKIGLPENRKRLKSLGQEKAKSQSFDEGWNAGFDAGFKAGVESTQQQTGDKFNANV
jgi:flagellar biosynthesis/type III secretory pathway protein FliH